MRAVGFDEGGVRDASGVKRTSNPSEVSLASNRQGDRACIGRSRSGEQSALARGVNEHGGGDSRGKICPDDNVVVDGSCRLRMNVDPVAA